MILGSKIAAAVNLNLNKELTQSDTLQMKDVLAWKKYIVSLPIHPVTRIRIHSLYHVVW